MKSLTVTKLCKNAARVLDLIEQRESIRVLRRGKVVATIVCVDVREPRLAWKRSLWRLAMPGASLSGGLRNYDDIFFASCRAGACPGLLASNMSREWDEAGASPGPTNAKKYVTLILNGST